MRLERGRACQRAQGTASLSQLVDAHAGGQDSLPVRAAAASLCRSGLPRPPRSAKDASQLTALLHICLAQRSSCLLGHTQLVAGSTTDGEAGKGYAARRRRPPTKRSPGGEVKKNQLNAIFKADSSVYVSAPGPALC